MSRIASLCLHGSQERRGLGGLMVTYGLWCDDNSNNITLCGARDVLVATASYMGVRLVCCLFDADGSLLSAVLVVEMVPA
jgi:hypothetical protein